MLGLIWVQTVCKIWQQKTLVGKKLKCMHNIICHQARQVVFDLWLSLQLLPYFKFAVSENVQMCRPVSAFSDDVYNE